MILNFDLHNQTLSKSSEVDTLHIVADSKNYLVAHFNFVTEDWKDRLVYALFTYNKQTYKMILGADDRLGPTECFIPHEVIHAPGFTVSCYCDTRITTNAVQVKVAKSGYTESIANQQATPSVMEQMGNYMKQYLAACNVVLENCEKIRDEIGGINNG